MTAQCKVIDVGVHQTASHSSAHESVTCVSHLSVSRLRDSHIWAQCEDGRASELSHSDGSHQPAAARHVWLCSTGTHSVSATDWATGIHTDDLSSFSRFNGGWQTIYWHITATYWVGVWIRRSGMCIIKKKKKKKHTFSQFCGLLWGTKGSDNTHFLSYVVECLWG